MKPAQSRPIGIFDSGLGGLTVFKAIHRLLPEESLIYFGDTAHVPYGAKSAETVAAYSLDIAGFLVGKNIKLLVVACNTASALALKVLREKIRVPVIGVIEPGARLAAQLTVNKKVGIIGTEATIRSHAYRDGLLKALPSVRVYEKACPLFVPLVEEGWWDKKLTRLAAEEYLSGLRKPGIDTLILGCTHYPVIKDVIRGAVGKKVRLVDSAQAVADETLRMLRRHKLEHAGGKPTTCFYASDDTARFARLAAMILGKPPAEVLLQKFC